jgi:hypothetical protein
METYLTLAEVVADRDDFCLTMLWSMTSELAHRADRAEQGSVVDAAAASLRGPDDAPSMRFDEALETAIGRLERVGFARSESIAPVVDGGGWAVTLDEYALAERTGRLPTLPVAVAISRRLPGTTFRFTAATPLGEQRWRLRVEPGGPPEGLVSIDATDDARLYDTGSVY